MVRMEYRDPRKTHCEECGDPLVSDIAIRGFYPCANCANIKATKEFVEEHTDQKVDDGNNIFSDYIQDLKEKEDILYKLARLVRNTDCIHVSKKGEMYGSLLVRLRNMDGETYDKLVISPEGRME